MAIPISTKARIFSCAIELFSQKGFYETSVREIAQLTGISVSSLYNHFKNKEAILDEILQYYKTELHKIKIPPEKLDHVLSTISPAELLARGFKRVTASVSNNGKLARILLIEMYRNPKVREFYLEWYYNENCEAVTQLFSKMQEKGLIKNYDPEFLATLYNSYVSFYCKEFLLLKAAGRETTGLENKVEQQLHLLLDLCSK